MKNKNQGMILIPSLEEKVEIHKQICSELSDIYSKKNHDYDDAFAKRFRKRGMIYPIDKLQEKLDRIEALDSGVPLVEGESLEDSLLDLANYAIMTLVERRTASLK